MATERCEAYVPASTAEREAKYWKNTGPTLPFLSRIMARLQEDSGDVWAWQKQHMDEVNERIKTRNLYTQAMPVMDSDKATTFSQFHRNQEYLVAKTANEANPRIGTLDYILKQATAEE